MSQNKTQPTNRSVSLFLDGIENDIKRKDSWKIYELMHEVTQEKGKMWGTSIVGFGNYHYTYTSGRKGDWFLTGFSPRKATFSLYLMCDLSHDKLNFKGLGKYKLGKGCLYIKKLAHIDKKQLKNIIQDSIAIVREMY